jgi:hypothetical protein
METETRCKACNTIIPQISGHRRREYCNDACKQRYYRERKDQKAKEQNTATIQTRYHHYLPITQHVLAAVAETAGLELAEQVAQAIKLETEYHIAETTVTLLRSPNRLYPDPQDDWYLTDHDDPTPRPFKKWLETVELGSKARRKLANHIIADTHLPAIGNKRMYLDLMRFYTYSHEDIRQAMNLWTWFGEQGEKYQA